MQIPNDLTRKQIFNLLFEQLDRIDEKHGPHECTAASVGYALEEFNEVVDALKISKGKASSAVVGEWIDLAVVCIRACDLYMHKEENK